MDDYRPNTENKIRLAALADLSYVRSLTKRFSNQIGFIPDVGIAAYLEKSAILIAEENGEPAGFLLGNPHLVWQPLLRPITQAAIQFDAQRHSHGRRLVDTIADLARSAGQIGIQANCREDLAANEFWQAAGFVKICYMQPSNARQQPIICWRKPLVRKLPIWFAAPPKRAGWRALPPTLATRAERIRNDRND